MPVAWQVDPALALSLQDHFPLNSDIKLALEQLVVEYAHAAKVCALLTSDPPTGANSSSILCCAVLYALQGRVG